MYKKCYFTCETCNIKGDNLTHNCLQCNINFSVAINHHNYFNCYNKCDFYYYVDNENNYHCTDNFSYPNEYPKLIEDKMEFIKYDIKDLLQNIPKYEKNETE